MCVYVPQPNAPRFVQQLEVHHINVEAQCRSDEMTDVLTGKIVYAFNQVLLGFIKDLRKYPALSKIIGKNYKIFDKDNESYLEHFAQVQDKLSSVLPHNQPDAFTFADLHDVSDLELIKGISIKCIFAHCIAETERAAVDKYILTLLSISILTRDLTDANVDDVINTMFVLLEKLRDIEQNQKVELSDVFDDELRNILDLISKTSSVGGPVSDMMNEDKGEGDVGDFMNKVMNSKIGVLAKELSQNMNIENIADPKSFATSGNMGNMIKTVAETMQKKISDGSMNSEELMSEAMDMIKMFDKGDMFKNLNKSALNNMERKLNTKTRLREKLQRRSTSNGQ